MLSQFPPPLAEAVATNWSPATELVSETVWEAEYPLATTKLSEDGMSVNTGGGGDAGGGAGGDAGGDAEPPCSTRVVLFVLPSRLALTVAFWLEGTTDPAVTLKSAVVAPPETVTVGGAESRELLLLTATAAPPEGAAEVNVSVHPAVPRAFREVGVQETPEIVGTVITAGPDGETVSPLAPGVTPSTLERDTEFVVAPADSVTWTVATTPAAIAFVFRPVIKQLYWPSPAAQMVFFPAAVAAGPGVAEIAAIWLEAYETENCRPAGAVPETESERLREALPPSVALADDSVRLF